MTNTMKDTMREAMLLMRAGDLHAATAAIQRGLRGGDPGVRDASQSDWPPVTAPIEGRYRVVPEDDAPSIELPRAGVTVPGAEGHFGDHRFTCDAGELRYKLFVPPWLAGGDPPPLLVMLHGCTQSPDDFARGTRMNALAREHGYVVAYPAQARRNNASRCWNWFRAEDQQRGQGEAALLAALTRHLVRSHRLDERRVYVAGLSAGGAMAAVLAGAYADVYAAVGVHSGLPFGVAHDLPSALAAMKHGRRQPPGREPPADGDRVPAIVFHGDSDATVHPCNGAAVVAQFSGPASGSGPAVDALQITVERGSVPGGRHYTRTIFTDDGGRVVAEQWTVHGAGHAWFGGDRAGSYTDPSGPDASSEMLRFFAACSRRTMN